LARLIDILLELASLPSRLINVLTGGAADLTFSARSHRDGLWTAHVINWIFFWQADHCRWAWDRELERSQANVAWAVKGRDE
jgi:hypothetical protein